jgi:GxxExxY protein
MQSLTAIHEIHEAHETKGASMTEIILREEVYQIIGAAMDVYYQLGGGFAEPVYQEALEIELARRKIPFTSQCKIHVYYKGQPLENFYKPDFLCFEQVVAEIKACDRSSGAEYSQIINYLKATRKRVGLLINFGSM